jgi:flavorubredoxin
LDHEAQHVLILYASETGNAQDMAERVARAIRAAHRKAVTLSMDDYDVVDLPHEPLIIFITSTHGRGDPPPAMRGLWHKLIRKGLPEDILEGAFALSEEESGKVKKEGTVFEVGGGDRDRTSSLSTQVEWPRVLALELINTFPSCPDSLISLNYSQ